MPTIPICREPVTPDRPANFCSPEIRRLRRAIAAASMVSDGDETDRCNARALGDCPGMAA